MVAHFPPAVRAAVGILSASLLLATCEFPGLSNLDVFPAYLQRVDAKVDLADLLKDEGFGPDYRIMRIEQVESMVDDASFVLVFIEEGEARRLLVLNADDLSISRSEENSAFTQFLGVDVQGRFLCGPTAFSSESTFASVEADLSTALMVYANHDRLESFGGGVFNALLGMNGDSIRLLDFTAPEAWTPYTDYSVRLSSASSYNFLDAVRGDGQTDAVRVLLSREDRIIVANFPDFVDLRATILAAQTAGSDFVSESSLDIGASLDGDRGWITRDGVVSSIGSKRELIFYPFSNLADGESFPLGQDYEDSFVSVDDEGDRWFLFNYKTGCLYGLRTWW